MLHHTCIAHFLANITTASSSTKYWQLLSTIIKSSQLLHTEGITWFVVGSTIRVSAPLSVSQSVPFNSSNATPFHLFPSCLLSTSPLQHLLPNLADLKSGFLFSLYHLISPTAVWSRELHLHLPSGWQHHQGGCAHWPCDRPGWKGCQACAGDGVAAQICQ